MLNFKSVAQSVGAIEQDLLNGRSKAKLESIYGETVTVRAFAVVHWKKNNEEGDYPAVLVDEYPDFYFPWSGVLLERALYGWASETGCHASDNDDLPFVDFEALNEELFNTTLKIRVTRGKTSTGNPLNRLEVIDG